MRDPQKNLERLCIFYFTIAIVTAACSPSTLPGEVSPVKTLISSDQVTNPAPNNQPVNTTSITFTPSQTIKSSQNPVPSRTPTSTFTSTATSTQTPVQTSSPTSTPTYAVLRGTVLEQANCRYGPGTWILIQAIGDNNPCWVKASLLDIQGDVMSVAPATLPLPQSPYYGPVTGIYAERIGDSVVISWDPINLKAGDDSQELPYLIEAWLCQDGQLTFTPIGSGETIVTVQDESGCIEPSHARVYGVEKNGYTSWVEVPWPQP
jgi:hypothetical protein